MRWLLATLLLAPLLLAPPVLRADDKAPSDAQMSEIFRGLVLANLPTPLVERDEHWGQQREAIVGVKWKRDGLLLTPEAIKKLHNDGTWRRIRVEADQPQKTLQLAVTDRTTGPDGVVRFGINVNMPVNARFEQQLWESGVRLYSGETRARCRVGALLKCEVSSQLELPKGSLLPDVRFRARVTEARLAYADVVVEHTLGVGGDAAKLLGEGMFELAKRVRPSLEEQLLIRGNAAVVKAGDTKELRLSLSKWLGGR